MRANPLLQVASVVVFLAAISPTAVSGQAIDSSTWQMLRPEGEEFSILMPKDPVIETGKMPYHKMEINTRLYISHGPATPTFAVVSLSGIKSNPAMYSDFERLNSYVDAFKKFFVPKVSTKEAIAKFVMTGPKTLNGHSGRQYQVTIGDRSGTAQVFATRRRFYAIVFLTKQKADDIRDQFLSSFVLPEYVKPAETVATQKAAPEPQVIDEEKQKEKENEKEQQSANAKAGAPATQDEKESHKAGETAEPNTENKANDSADANAANKPISGGVLNGKALSLPLPPYPPEARAANASGSVSVKVTIDEWGTVISATAVSGHPLLQHAAVSAARQARFSPTTLMGQPVKVVGVLVYNFVQQ